MQPFASDIKKIRERARQHINEGAITGAYKADREQVIKVLNEALATELVCVLRYKRHYFMAKGIHSDPVKATSSSRSTGMSHKSCSSTTVTPRPL